MTNKDNEILTSVYGKDAPDLAKFGKGGSTIDKIKEAVDARRAQSDAAKPRQYSER
jgi:hypothetical protein